MKTLRELIHPSEILSANVALDIPVGDLAHDSRTVRAGSAYFAFRGTKIDGHAFAAGALQGGAAVVVADDPVAYATLAKAVLVRNTREALALAASRWWDEPTRHLRVVGITGTNGKTTTTYLLRSLWDKLGLTSGIIGTVEYHIGAAREPATLTTPDPLPLQGLFHRMHEADVKVAAMEVSSIALDQRRVAGTNFEVGLFTNLTQDHLDYHGDLETYYRAKLRLFTDYSLRYGVVNIDDPYGARLAREATCPVLSFSLSPEAGADFAALEVSLGKAGGRARVRTPKGEISLSTPLIGKHNLYNVLGALATSHALGYDLTVAAQALADAQGAPGRLERVTSSPQHPHVFVDYAHTPDALENVLKALRPLRGNDSRIVTVFGCGGDRDRGKRPKMAALASSLSDVTVATSDNPRTEEPNSILDDIEAGIAPSSTEYHREVNRKRAIHLALKLARPGDLVLVAGKGHETYQIVGKELFPFDDREVIRDYYRDIR